jgi:hypothetical protein
MVACSPTGLGNVASSSQSPSPSPFQTCQSKADCVQQGQPAYSPDQSQCNSPKCASPAPSPITPIPTPAAELLTCRLPISGGQFGSGGFVVFPGGQFVADPASIVVIPGVPTPSPQFGYGYAPSNFFGLTYDRAYSRWLPVPRQFVAPDGSRYVYPSPDSVYAVSVAGGPTLELGQGQGHTWNVLDVENEGVYATVQSNSNVVPAGLWLLPFSGGAVQVVTTGYWHAVGGGAAYGYEAPSAPSGVFQRLMRLDLKTGLISPWFDEKSQALVIGFDARGAPIATLQGNPQLLVLLAAPNAPTFIYDGTPAMNLNLNNGVLADPNGIWVPTGNGLYIFGANTGRLDFVSQVSGPLAGACL